MPAEQRQRFAAQVEPTTYDEADGTIGLVVYAGAEVPRIDWMTGEHYTLRLEVSPEAVDLTRLQSGSVPLLDSHDDSESECVLGAVLPDSAMIGAGKITVRAKLSVDPEHAGKIANVRAGVLRNISVGASPIEVKSTAATKTSPRRDVWTRWAIDEVSIVPIPADPGAQTLSQQAAAEVPKMDLNQTPAPEPVDLAKVREEATQAERSRLAEIDTAAKAVGADAATVAKLKADGVSADDARKQLLNAAAARSDASASRPQLTVLRDAGDTAIEQAKHALLAKAVPANIEAKIDGKISLLWDGDKAAQFRGQRVVDIVRHALGATGQLRDGMGDREVLRRALLAHSSSDLPDLFGDSTGKALLYGYQVQEKQYERFCKRVQTPGLHARKPVIVSGASAVEEMAEGAPYPQQNLGDTAESYSAKKYGGQVAITLEALLRDDLDALAQIPTGLSNGLVIKQNAIVAALFAAGSGYGPTLAADSTALFNLAHANLVDTGSGGAPTMARFAALRTLLAKMEDAQGNLQPRQLRYIVVPAELFHTAEALLLGQAMPGSLSVESRTPSLSRLEIVPFDYLAGAKKYYGFADPNISPVIEVATPNNMPEVWAESVIDFDTDCRKIKAGMYFAAAAVDFRGAAMNFGE
jgi:phage head maturation protease